MIKTFTLSILIAYSFQCPDDPFCRSCKIENKTNICQQCQYSAIDKNTGECNQVNKPIDHCLTYHDNISDGCFECEFDYGLDSNKKCVACDDNCYVCAEDMCLSCKDGLKPNNYKCDGKGKKCNKENCEICTYLDQCYKCNFGFSLDENNNCIKGLDNCLKLLNKDECDTCDAGYYINNKQKCSLFVKKSVSGFFFYFFIIAILALSAYGIYYFIKKRQDEDYIHKMEEEYVSVG